MSGGRQSAVFTTRLVPRGPSGQAASAGADGPTPAMPRTVCSIPGCPAMATQRGWCAKHFRTTTERGYGPDHQAARASLRATLPAVCAYGCGTWLTPGGDWVAAHVVDGDPSQGWVTACISCNERAKSGHLKPSVPAADLERPLMRVIG